MEEGRGQVGGGGGGEGVEDGGGEVGGEESRERVESAGGAGSLKKKRDSGVVRGRDEGAGTKRPPTERHESREHRERRIQTLDDDCSVRMH